MASLVQWILITRFLEVFFEHLAVSGCRKKFLMDQAVEWPASHKFSEQTNQLMGI